jgi:hypothetical protein
VFQSDHEYTAGDDATHRTARSDTAAEAGSCLEREVIFEVEQLLPRADNGLRSIEELIHVAFDALAHLFLDFFLFHQSIAPFSSDIALSFRVAETFG